ncbi:hypothetical protein BKA56DRAFT_529467 [Ilyonectria sp. MPI-CAGE-AT-0026]|nr:hypothetical protein BKA56DRAFT_529467 [Ilyonectria sp. MPI-CAGE-AT-0026]
MSTRRPHTKSRLGCTSCKRRKVKCDEIGPICFQCRRHHISCSLRYELPRGSVRRSERVEDPGPNTIIVEPTNCHASYSSPVNVTDCSQIHMHDKMAPFPPHELRALGWQLMHHYCTVTADTLSRRKEIVHVWQTAIPLQGYRYPFVMHGILAIAATHRAYLEPGCRNIFLPLADYHQTMGSIGYRVELQHIDAQNWIALYSFKSLLMIHMLTLPTRMDHYKLNNPIGSLGELIGLLRGIESTVRPFLSGVINSGFQPLVYSIWPLAFVRYLTDHFNLGKRCLPPDTYQAVARLRAFQRCKLPLGSLDQYQLALDNLEACFCLAILSRTHIEAGYIFVWLHHIQDNLRRDLSEYRPHALLLMSYFSVFLASAEKSFWYLKGWARQILDEVVARLAGQPMFLELVEWPKKQLFNLLGE